MNKELRESIKKSTNNIVHKLLEIADEKGLCRYDELGTCSLEGVPVELLIKTVIASLKDNDIKLLQSEFGSQIKDSVTFEKQIKAVEGFVSDILRTYFIDILQDKTMTTKEYAKIVGYQSLGREEWIPLFFPLVLFELAFGEQEQEKQIRQMFVESLFQANQIKIALGLTFSRPDADFDRKVWQLRAEEFVNRRLKNNYQERVRTLREVGAIATRLEYILKGEWY